MLDLSVFYGAVDRMSVNVNRRCDNDQVKRGTEGDEICVTVK